MVREPRADAWGSSLLRLSKEEPMTIFQEVKQSPVAAAKAERQRDKTEAMREYQAENLACHANMARLRALRLAKESTDSQPQTAQRPAKRKAASRRR